MRRIFRALSLVLITVVMASSLSGCLMIDVLRDEQAFVGEDSTIEYKGNKYMLLPFDEALNPISTEDNSVYVTEKDVPVLLSIFLGTIYNVSDDGAFIFTYSDGGYICYCIEERFDEISKMLSDGYEMDNYCYEYYDYDEEDYRYYRFSNSDVEAMVSVIQNVEAQQMPEGTRLDYDYAVIVEACSDDMYFRKNVAQIVVKNNNYQIVVTENDGTENEKNLLYKVPEELNETFEKIMKSIVSNEFYIDEF